MLEPPDIHYLSAALGWMELGNFREAKAELARISTTLAEHADVLEVRWLILAAEQNWPAALDMARILLKGDPDRPFGWLHQAYALRRVPDGGLQAAWDALHPVADRFPQEPTIPYNLSCYACQMGRLEEARKWLQRACAVAGKASVKSMALADADLEPLWTEIRRW